MSSAGAKDQAPMLYNGEQVGDGTGPECDVAVDPIDGTRTEPVTGMPNAMISRCRPSSARQVDV
mgnify:CR=1 FL=1